MENSFNIRFNHWNNLFIDIICQVADRLGLLANFSRTVLYPIAQGILIRRIPTYHRLHTTPLAMSDTEEISAPDGATAQRLVKEFEAVTNTDEIMAQFYLQVRNIFMTQLVDHHPPPGEWLGPAQSSQHLLCLQV